MKIIKNQDIDNAAWDSLILSNRHSTPFQTREFYNFFNSVNGLSAEALAVYDGGAIKALAVVTNQVEPGLMGFISKRCIIYGGPLVESGEVNALKYLLQQIEKLRAKNVIYTETRNLSDYSEFHELFLGENYIYNPYVNFNLKVESRNTVWKNISNSRKRQINKAIRQGVVWKIAENIDEVRTFYSILQCLYKKKVRKPLLPEDFFLKFFDSGLGKYFIVTYDQRVIGGIMCPILNGKSIYEFYVCGLDEQFKDQYPSVMATWSAIEYAVQNHIPVFDFMGAGPNKGQYGVRDFKARFGGNQVEYGRFTKVNKPLHYAIGSLGLKIRGGLKN